MQKYSGTLNDLNVYVSIEILNITSDINKENNM